MKEYDYINPDHYKKGNKEVWEMMVDIWGKEAFITFCEISSFKYRMRLGKKPDQPIDRDLEKAKWYENKAKELSVSYEGRNKFISEDECCEGREVIGYNKIGNLIFKKPTDDAYDGKNVNSMINDEVGQTDSSFDNFIEEQKSKIPPDLLKFLDEKGVTGKYIKNCLDENLSRSHIYKFKGLESEEIVDAFHWEPSPEGDRFWNDISSEYYKAKKDQ